MKPLLSKSPVDRRVFSVEVYCFQTFNQFRTPPLLREVADITLPLARRVYDPGLIINPKTHMAWRPYQNLIDGELDNRTPAKVTGWIRFFRLDRRPLKVNFDLVGDFHEDIRGKVIRLSNPNPADRNVSLDRKGTYMDGFGSVQHGEVGDIRIGRPGSPVRVRPARRRAG